MATLLEQVLDLELVPEAHVRKKIVRVSEATWHRMRHERITPSPAIMIRGRRYYRPEVIEGWLRSNEELF
ncbi:MAG TPA: hypothetical protein DCZ75_05350 [Geobacter sp.]|nr:hypothetical protein [Geobacter sp.]